MKGEIVNSNSYKKIGFHAILSMSDGERIIRKSLEKSPARQNLRLGRETELETVCG